MPAKNPSILPVSKLLDKTFVIPFFQRGYRWTGIEITALLEDLHEFQKKGTGSLYCLQPLVVVDKGQGDRLTVIDGQQRLTTIFLLLSYLNYINTFRRPRGPFNLLFEGRPAQQRLMKYKKFSGIRSPFKLLFEVRRAQQRFMKHKRNPFTLIFKGRPLQQQFMKDKRFSVAGDTSFRDNIDNFYLRKAWETIKAWHEAKLAAGDKPDIGALLTTSGQKYAAVIFYEIDKADAVDAFRRLNHGKIPLTSAEIVKALLLQSDCYADREKMAAVATLRGVEWDRMERDLADPYLGGMLGLDAVAGPARMGVILDSVAKDLGGKEVPEKMDLFAYHVINGVLEKADDREREVGKVWTDIRRTCNRIMNWRKNRRWYHLIGLYALLPEKNREDYRGLNLLRRLYTSTTEAGNSKSAFERSLKSKIGTMLRVPDHNRDGAVDLESKRALASPDLSYHGAYEYILRRILTAFNVWTVYQDPDEYRLFPFHLFRAQSPMTLEHIHPQSLADEMKPGQEHIRKAILTWWAATRNQLDLLPKGSRNELAEARAQLDQLDKDRDSFDTEKAMEHIRTVGAALNQHVSMDEAKIHSLENLALLDGPSNAALSNGHMDEKRAKLEEKIRAGEWMPPATVDVFSKKYSAGKIKNMQFWLPEDREAYLEAIKEVYAFFVNADPSKEKQVP